MTAPEHSRRGAMQPAGLHVDRKLPGWLGDGGFDLVLDVGANKGQFAQELFAAGYGGRIVSFEPLSQAHAHLLAASAGNSDWQVAERCALGAARGEYTINIAGNLESSSLLDMLDAHVRSAPGSAFVGSETVSVRTLDEIAASSVGAATKAFLKLDVQGYEAHVLDGAAGLMPMIQGLQIEASLVPMYDGEALYEALLAKARGLGFTLFWARPGHRDPQSGRVLQLDMILFRDAKPSTPASHTTGDDALDVFVIIHDQDLLLACEADGRFSNLPGYRYVFVGNRAVDRISHLDSVVVARDLPFNIEEFPDLVAFTAWYAIAKNALATQEYVCLLEYDVELEDDFHEASLAALREGRRIVGYVPVPLTDPVYLFSTQWFIRSLAEVYGIDVPALIGEYVAAGGEDVWTATSNASMSTADLEAVVDWILPLTCVYRHDPEAAHVHERTLKIFCLFNAVENYCLAGRLVHFQKNSHEIPTSATFHADFTRMRAAVRYTPSRFADAVLGAVKSFLQRLATRP